MNGQTLNFKRYENSLKNMQQPVLPSQLPKKQLDLAGLSKYAKDKNLSLWELTEKERQKFL